MQKNDIQNLINLLYTGKWNLSLQETDNILKPLIQKLSEELEKKDEKKDNT